MKNPIIKVTEPSARLDLIRALYEVGIVAIGSKTPEEVMKNLDHYAASTGTQIPYLGVMMNNDWVLALHSPLKNTVVLNSAAQLLAYLKHAKAHA